MKVSKLYITSQLNNKSNQNSTQTNFGLISDNERKFLQAHMSKFEFGWLRKLTNERFKALGSETMQEDSQAASDLRDGVFRWAINIVKKHLLCEEYNPTRARKFISSNVSQEYRRSHSRLLDPRNSGNSGSGAAGSSKNPRKTA